MSLRNVINANNKAWLDAKFGVCNMNTLNILSGDTLNITSAGTVNIQTQPGTQGQAFGQDNSGNLAWKTDVFGEHLQTAEALAPGSFNTTSATPVVATGVSFSPSGLVAGTYILHFSCENRNTAGSMTVTLRDITGGGNVIMNTFSIYGSVGANQNVSSFNIITIPAGTRDYQAYINSVVGGQISYIEDARFIIYRLF